MNVDGTVDYGDLEFVLMRQHMKATIMPRFTPSGWWECDVCEITRAGYMREYEIKMTRTDFKVDAEKAREVWNGSYSQPHPRPIEKKHDLLSAGDPRGPTMFYFVTPKGLLRPEEIPVWAGWIEVARSHGSSYAYSHTLKPAPRLHKVKVKDGVGRDIRGACYGRLHHIWFRQHEKFCGQRYLKEKPAPDSAG